jgi:hypothetical protein
MKVRKHSQVSVVKNSYCGSLNFGSYTPWKIGFVASPETGKNQVFRVKMSQLLHNRSKFSETNCVSYIIVFNILYNIFRNIHQIFCVGHALQGRSLE